LEGKCFVLSEGDQLWEKMENNRKLPFENLVLKFNERTWGCTFCLCEMTSVPIVCKNAHPVCTACFDDFANYQMDKGEMNFRCCKCDEVLPGNDWVNILPTKTRNRLANMKIKENGGTICVCPNVNCLHETIQNPGHDDLLACAECGTTWCTKCERAVEAVCNICNEGLNAVLKDIMEAVAESNGTKCPGCKMRGRKNPSECTHITCECGTLFCYACGKDAYEVDNEGYNDSAFDRLSSHNEDWPDNPARCPMYIEYLAESMPGWTDLDAGEMQERFHVDKAAEKLRKARENAGEHIWSRVLELDERLNEEVTKWLPQEEA